MSRYRKVTVAMWGDAKFCALSRPEPCAQFLWLYLLTGPYMTCIPGVIRAKPGVLAAELEWSPEAFREAFREVLSQGLCEADEKAGLMWLPNACRHNKPESPNVVRSWRTAWAELPDSDLKPEIWRQLKAFVEGFGEGYAKAFAEVCPHPSPNQEQEQEQDQEQDQGAPLRGSPPRARARARTRAREKPAPAPSIAPDAVSRPVLADLDARRHRDLETIRDQYEAAGKALAGDAWRTGDPLVRHREISDALRDLGLTPDQPVPVEDLVRAIECLAAQVQERQGSGEHQALGLYRGLWRSVRTLRRAMDYASKSDAVAEVRARGGPARNNQDGAISGAEMLRMLDEHEKGECNAIDIE